MSSMYAFQEMRAAASSSTMLRPATWQSVQSDVMPKVEPPVSAR